MSTDLPTAQSIDSTGIVYCKHGEPAARRTLKTPKDLNRPFYCCKRPHGDSSRCDFWHWADDPVSGSSGSSKVEGTGPGPNTPQTTSSQKQTPQSSKRLLDIEAGLRQRDLDLSPTRRPGPSKLPGLPIDTVWTAPPNSSAKDAPPQPPSPVATEVDDTEERPRRTYSFLGLEYSPEPRNSTIDEMPSTPKKRRLTPPGETIEDAAKVLAAGATVPVDSLPTPPKTTQRAARPANPHISTAKRDKGKGREDIPSDDRAYPSTSNIGNNGEPLEEDALPVFTDREGSSESSGESPTIAENVLDYTEGVKARVKALSSYISSFDITQAGKHLQTIERQKHQYELRDQCQKTQIQELMVERDELRATVTRLEEALLLSEERNRTKDVELEALRAKRAGT